MRKQRFTAEELFAIRNDIPIDWVIDSVLKIQTRQSEGIIRFLCPCCGDFHTAMNGRTNLARCFRCRRNFNPIDLVMALRGMSFVAAVTFLQQCQIRCKSRNVQTMSSDHRAAGEPLAISEILRRIVSQGDVDNER